MWLKLMEQKRKAVSGYIKDLEEPDYAGYCHKKKSRFYS